MAAYQCPRCPLLFTFRPELELHLREDHLPAVPPADEEPEAVEPGVLAAS